MTLWRGGRTEGKAARAGGAPLPGPVLFLDRDGVVLQEAHYLKDPAGVTLVPGAAAALRRIRRHGYRVVGVSNQSGIGRGYYTEEDFAAVQTRVDELLAAQGTAFDAFFYCPHAPEDGCRCRKPAPGLLAEAGRLFAWDPADSWVVGDKLSDVQLGLDAGMRAILVRTGHGREQEALLDDPICRVADDLAAAVDIVLEARV